MVYLFLANGFEEIEALTAVDFCRRADIEITTVGIGGRSVAGAHGITVIADIAENEISANSAEIDMMILPGGMPGAKNLDGSSTVDEFIEAAKETDAFICAICAAPFILGKRGILNGKNATCYPGFEDDLLGAKTVDAGVVRDGKIITGRAPGAAAEFALEIVKALKGEETAERIRAGAIV